MSTPFNWEDCLVAAVLNDIDGQARSIVGRIPASAFEGLTGRAWRAFESAKDIGNPCAVLAAAGFAANEILAWVSSLRSIARSSFHA
jgi:hypothetical protein